jgi:GxxExxY protein
MIITSKREEEVAKMVVNSAYIVHKLLGPGLLESVYEACFCHELKKAGLQYAKQSPVPIIYDDICFDAALRLDVLVENLVICELKSVEAIHPIFHSQLLSYMKLSQKHLGFLINFNVPTIKEGIKRFIL